MNVGEMKDNYMASCNAYLEKFCRQMELDITEAAWQEMGVIAKVEDVYISMHNIIVAVEKNISRIKFNEWCDYCTAAGVEDLTTCKLDNWLKN